MNAVTLTGSIVNNFTRQSHSSPQLRNNWIQIGQLSFFVIFHYECEQ